MMSKNQSNPTPKIDKFCRRYSLTVLLLTSIIFHNLWIIPAKTEAAKNANSSSQSAHKLSFSYQNSPQSLLEKYAEKVTDITSTDGFAAKQEIPAEIFETVKVLTQSQRVNPIIIRGKGWTSKDFMQTLTAQVKKEQKLRSLRQKQFYRLNTKALYTETKSATEIAVRLYYLINEIKLMRADEDIILFVEELSTLLGRNSANDGSQKQLLIKICEILQYATTVKNLSLIGTVATRSVYSELIDQNTQISNKFVLINPIQNADDASKLIAQRERLGFAGNNFSTDLLNFERQSGEKDVEVVLQTDKVNSRDLDHLLSEAKAKVISKTTNFETLTLKVPAKYLPTLKASRMAYYISPNRTIKSLGHLSQTVGLDAVLAQSGQNHLKGTGIGIAIVDSGVDPFHTTFSYTTNGISRVVKYADFTGAQYGWQDDFGHGTHVGSVAAGATMNDGDARFNGVAENATIINARVLDAQGHGTVSRVLEALDWILSVREQHNIRVVNLSLGAPAIDSYLNDPLCRAVRKLVDHGIVVIVAAGNDGKNVAGDKIYGRIHSPGNEPSAITVGAANTFGTSDRSDDVVTTYSSRGPTRSFYKDANNVKHYDNLIKPDIVAPGNKIIAAEGVHVYLNNHHPGLRAKNAEWADQRAMYLSGTSVAAPVVSGAVAVMLQANPYLTPNLVKAILQYTAQPLAGYNQLEQGAGQLNLVGAVRLAKLVRQDMQAKFVTDLPYIPINNGLGPVEKDQSNGFGDANDGFRIKLNGVEYAKGLGVHASESSPTQVSIMLNGNYQFFMVDIGVDDVAEESGGTVTFEVWADGAKLYDSGIMNQNTPTQSVKIDVNDKQELKLIVTDGGDGNQWDWADWAAARLTPRISLNENLLTDELPLGESSIGIGANFIWAQGLIFNRTYAVGNDLMTKSQRVYGEGFLLNDGIIENHSNNTVSIKTNTMSPELALQTQIRTNLNGGALWTGSNFLSITNLLGDGTILSDGHALSDSGTLGSDGHALSDSGTIKSDSLFGLSVLVNGDNTACMTAQ